MTGLCEYEDVISRMADVGLASASEDASDTVALVERKILQAHSQIELELVSRIQRAIAPYQTDGYNNTPLDVVGKITNEAKAYLKQCAVTFTIRAMYEEGETRMRFRYQEAGDTIAKVLARWDKLCLLELDRVYPLLTFDQDGNGTITLIERMLTNNFTSVRITM